IALTSNMGDTLYECQYNAYGQIINETYHQDDFQALPDNPLRFQGQYYDEETGLHYNLNRYYDPFTGRYITQDPLGILGGLNSYQYAGSDPINWIDPLGLVKVENSGFEHLELSDRHLLDRVSIPKATGNSIFTGTRTEALADLAEIKSGVAIRDGELFTTSSGRVWGIHNNSVHPVSGPGVVNISSLEYNILVQARKRGKDNALITLGHLEKNKKLSSEKIERVKILLNLMKDRK
ncbi:RHS repeat-associated core domain-containing protein, partial [Gilliamella intestini]